MVDNKLLKKDIIKEFPKIELHRHLEGTMSPKILYELSIKNNLGLPKDFDEFKKVIQFPKGSDPDFLLFLSKFKNNWYGSLEDVATVTYESIKELKNDGLFYIELRFSPEHYALQNNFDRKEVTKLIVEYGNKAANEVSIYVKYLITFNRAKQNQDEMINLYNQIKKLGLKDIVGIDLAGDETNFPPKLFTKFFSEIYHDGIYKSTIHAGEVTPSSQIWESIFYLYANRIGHGVSTIKDRELQYFLKDNQIYLEQCITSNYQTGAWTDEKNHPFGKLFKIGVPITLNSDDPVIQGTDLTDDYIKAIKYFNLTLDDLIRLNLQTIKASFLTDKEKKELEKKYLIEVKKFKDKYGF